MAAKISSQAAERARGASSWGGHTRWLAPGADSARQQAYLPGCKADR